MPTLARTRKTPADITHADNPFGRYKPEPPKELREAVITSTPLDKLRARRESLKLLSPEQALAQMKLHPNLTLFEALELTQKEGKLIVPNIVHDGILNGTEEKYAVWTGTLIIYERPNQPFGKNVTFAWTDGVVPYSVTFEVPESLRGRVNCAIVLEYPDFELVRTGERSYQIKLTEGAEIHLAEDFPVKSGRYLQNELGIPHGKTVKESPEARYLLREGSSSYAGLLGRGGDYDGWGQYVIACYRASGGLGVAFAE